MTNLALVLLLIVVVGLAVATTVGYVRGGLPVATPDVPPPLDAPVTEAADLDRARFGLALRGYRMDQVDEVLDGARDALAARDTEIARLRQELDGGDEPQLTLDAGVAADTHPPIADTQQPDTQQPDPPQRDMEPVNGRPPEVADGVVPAVTTTVTASPPDAPSPTAGRE